MTEHIGPRVGIIGAGLSGVSAADLLSQRGVAVTIFDKGRGPGGRASTRRRHDFSFDHGAQYFTARDPAFISWIDSCRAAGTVDEWLGRIAVLGRKDHPEASAPLRRLVGVPKMSVLVSQLAEDLDVRFGCRIETLFRDKSSWNLVDAAGHDWGPFDALIITAPPAQAAHLAAPHTALAEDVGQLLMEPCWAVLCAFSAPVVVPFDGAFCHNSALSWICRNNSKPGRPEAESWVLHATTAWTRQHEDSNGEEVSQLLLEAFERACGTALPELIHSESHFWKFARPVDESPVKNRVDRSACLVFAGDAFRGGRVEGAWLSGRCAAEETLALLQQ